MQPANKLERILEEYKKVFKKYDFEFTEMSDEKFLWIRSSLQFEKFENMKVSLEAVIDRNCAAVQISLHLFGGLPEDKIHLIDETVGILNGISILGHLYRDTSENSLFYISGIFLGPLDFNTTEFEKVFRALMGVGLEHLNVIRKALEPGADYRALLGDHLARCGLGPV